MSLADELRVIANKAMVDSIAAEQATDGYKALINLFKEQASKGSRHCYIDLQNPVRRRITLEAIKLDGFKVKEEQPYRFKIGWE